MSHFSSGRRTSSSSTSSPPTSDSPPSASPYADPKAATLENRHSDPRRPLTPPIGSDYGIAVDDPSRNSLRQRQRSSSRPMSMIQTYQPALMDIDQDIIPELQPIFTFLNSQSNRLYHEGYFLKLDDQNTQGKPNPDRTWTECFAQLIGTVLSLWDAAELEAAGEGGEVLPRFINLTDASIKMLESLPTRSMDEQPLQNILSISTAGRNRYLLHFNSHDSLLEWTGAIRLAMFEHSALQEAYTGALIAGKGKTLNNINIIMERSRFKTEVWARVRFGAGVPWRRCWCVITPPDEKDYAKLQKGLKKRSVYDRSPVPVIKGDIKFYDTKIEGKKQKKAHPIASITDAYSAYAVYPQAKSLVDASTLIKIEGDISIHTNPPSSSEGFVFVMPETRPAISGFETMMQFLFPTWDTFGLYGRPGKLVASVLDSRSLMFAMPRHKQLGYLGLQDVTGLLQSDATKNYREREWRKRLKEATGTRMNSGGEGGFPPSHSRNGSRASGRLSFGGLNGGISGLPSRHVRDSSESDSPERFPSNSPDGHQTHLSISNRERGASVSSDDARLPTPSPVEAMRPSHTPELVLRPPAFNHDAQDRPAAKPYQSPELRRMNSRLSSNTLAQMARAGGIHEPSGLSLYSATVNDANNEELRGPAVPPHTSPVKPYFDGDRFQEDRPPSHHSMNRPHSNHANSRPTSHHSMARPSSIQTASRPPSNHSQQRPPSSPSSQYSGYRYWPGVDEPSPVHSEGRRSPFAPGLNGGFPAQAPPSPRPLPRIPPQDHRFNSPTSAPTDPAKHKSLMPEHIIDHYTSQPAEAWRQLPSPPTLPAPHYQGLNDEWESGRARRNTGYPARDMERSRAGVLKTVGGAEEAPKPASPLDYDLPEVDFGRTINYGAPAVFNKQQHPGRGDAGRARQDEGRGGPQVRATMAWHAPSSPNRYSQGVNAEQFVQQMASAPYGDGRRYSAHGVAGGHEGGQGSPRERYAGVQTQSSPNVSLHY